MPEEEAVVTEEASAPEPADPPVEEPAVEEEPVAEEDLSLPEDSPVFTEFLRLLGLADVPDELRFAGLSEFLSHPASAQTPKSVQAELVAWMRSQGSTIEYAFPA